MRKGKLYGIAFLALFLLIFIISGETLEKPKENKITPSVVPTITKMPEEKNISTLFDGVSVMLGIPTSTPVPTATPMPTRKELIADYWMDEFFNECKVVDCDEYYFEVISFIECKEGGYALETVFENRQEFAVYLSVSVYNINFLRHPLGIWSADWANRMVGPGKRERVEFWIPDDYVEQLAITKVEDFSYASVGYEVTAVAEMYFDYNEYGYIDFCPYGRDKVVPYEHVVEADDIVLVDREGAKLILTDFTYDEENGGYRVDYYWENSTEHVLMHDFYKVSVNGYMCSPFYYSDNSNISLHPGIGAYEYLYFYQSDFKKCGITSVTELHLEARLYYDAGIWQYEDLVRETFCISPPGAEAAQQNKRTLQETDIVLFDTEDYTMVITGFSRGKEYSSEVYNIHVYAENRTEHYLEFAMDTVTINGEACDNPYGAGYVMPGKYCYAEISWIDPKDEIKNYPIVEKIDFTAKVSTLDEEKNRVLFEKDITVRPKQVYP